MPQPIKKYKNLTNRERNILKLEGVSNGCGGHGSKFNPPEFFFNASCNEHDYNYWKGGKFKDKLKADIGFFKVMLQDVHLNVKGYNSVKKLFLAIACLYFLAVLLLGNKYFNYKNPKTNKDLRVIFDKYKNMSDEEINILILQKNG